MSDYKRAALMIHALPPAKQLLGDKGYDANWFRQAVAAGALRPAFHPRRSRELKQNRSNLFQCPT